MQIWLLRIQTIALTLGWLFCQIQLVVYLQDFWILFFYQKNISYERSFIFNCIAMLAGLVGCAFFQHFYLTLFFVFLIGFSSNYGESVILCYMTYRRKSGLLKLWSSGTGMAGIFGASYSLITQKYHLNYKVSFYALFPTVLIYFLCFLGCYSKITRWTFRLLHYSTDVF